MKPPLNLTLYLVTDEELARGRATVTIVRAAIQGGVTMVQLRAKELAVGEQIAIGRELRAVTREAGVPFIVNDRADLAVALEADGVHVGQEDLPADLARRVVGPDRIVGVSVSSPGEAAIARAHGADYLGVGAIYGTTTKLDAGSPTGPALIRAIRAIIDLPIVGIGGINRRNAADVIAAGAQGVAVVSAIVAADDPAAAARDLRAAIAQVSEC